jgi:hypothetical protein
MTSNGPASITAIIQEITGGRPYVFMLMPFGSDWHLYERVKSAVQDVIKLTCIRADDIPGAGFDLLEKIHIAIERSELVIAEVSDRNPNVFYELGFAVGIKKPILLLAHRNVEIPSDLRGRELILHTDDRNGVEAFNKELRNHLQGRLNSQVALLRDMLEGERPQPAYIVASPKYPTEESRITGQPRDYRTFGDNLGVLGLLSAFGSIFGETSGVELVSGQFCSPEMPDRDQNVYLIGSPKVNLATERVMAMIQSQAGVRWGFSSGTGDYAVKLFRIDGEGKEVPQVGRKAVRDIGEVHVEDYGIILRGPHPRHAGRLLMVMAGAHSLGTGAACIAATRSQHIREIKRRGIDIADRRQAFWVLVRGKASARDGLLDVDDVFIDDVGIYSRVESNRA